MKRKGPRGEPIFCWATPDEKSELEAAVERARARMPPGAELALSRFVIAAALEWVRAEKGRKR